MLIRFCDRQVIDIVRIFDETSRHLEVN